MKASVIWSPRYWDKKVLVATRDVRPEKCYLFFCCDRNYSDLYSYDGVKVQEECKICSNGKIYCYEIPLEWLKNEGELSEEFQKIRDSEYQKYKNRKK